MNDVTGNMYIYPAAMARKIPSQERSKQRIDLVIRTTESMLESIEMEDISIPAIAKESGILRASIYQFFPNKYVLLNHILELHVTKLMNTILANSRSKKVTGLIDIDYIRYMSNMVAEYYNSNKVTATLVFSGLKSGRSYSKFDSIISSMGKAFFNHAYGGEDANSFSVYSEFAKFATEISFACMRNGYYRDGFISPETCEESSRAVYGYLAVSLELRSKN